MKIFLLLAAAGLYLVPALTVETRQEDTPESSSTIPRGQVPVAAAFESPTAGVQEQPTWQAAQGGAKPTRQFLPDFLETGGGMDFEWVDSIGFTGAGCNGR